MGPLLYGVNNRAPLKIALSRDVCVGSVLSLRVPHVHCGLPCGVVLNFIMLRVHEAILIFRDAQLTDTDQ